MQYLKITAVFTGGSPEFAEELITPIFLDAGMKGVVCHVPLTETDQGFGTNTLPPVTEPAIEGYLPNTDEGQGQIAAIQGRVQSLADIGIQVTLRVETVEDRQWADAWKQFFDVIRISDRLVVKPTWKPFNPGPRDRVIHLDPGMAFGTGTHPSTVMCLKRIEALIQPGNGFLDVGCGSGILMIAAALLGAGRVTGIDIDETAVAVARDNLVNNGINSERYRLLTGPLDRLSDDEFDLVAVNIIAQTITGIMAEICERLRPGGAAILSGIIQEREAEVVSAADRQGMTVRHRMTTDEWVTLTLSRVPGTTAHSGTPGDR